MAGPSDGGSGRARGGSSEDSPRRQEILRIAADVFAEQGFRGTTVRDIADRAELLSGSLFYHFRTKDSMVEELVRPVFEEFVQLSRTAAELDGPAASKLAALGRGYITGLRGDRLQRAQILYKDWRYLAELFPYLEDGMREINDIWLRVLRQGVADGTVRSDVDPSILFHVVQGVFSDVMRWYEPDGPRQLEEIADAVVLTILTGLRSG